jgi:hypothetical protein
MNMPKKMRREECIYILYILYTVYTNKLKRVSSREINSFINHTYTSLCFRIEEEKERNNICIVCRTETEGMRMRRGVIGGKRAREREKEIEIK